MRQQIKQLAKEFVDLNPLGRSLICKVAGQSQLLLAYQATTRRPAGSLAKLALAIAVGQALSDGTVQQNKLVRVSELPETTNPSIWTNFSPDRQLSLIEITNLMLSLSDNVGAQYIFNLLGPVWINQALQTHGIVHTNLSVGFLDQFLNEESAANMTTCIDALAMLELLTDQETLFGNWFSASLHNGFYRNRIGYHLPWTRALANKTATVPALGLVSDVGIYHGQTNLLKFAFICQDEMGINAVVNTSTQIASFVKEVMRVTGEQVKKSATK